MTHFEDVQRVQGKPRIGWRGPVFGLIFGSPFWLFLIYVLVRFR